MADITGDMLQKLWYATPESSWSSLISGLNELYSYETINLDQYQALEYAINKCASHETDFPDSVGELYQLLDPYM